MPAISSSLLFDLTLQEVCAAQVAFGDLSPDLRCQSFRIGGEDGWELQLVTDCSETLDAVARALTVSHGGFFVHTFVCREDGQEVYRFARLTTLAARAETVGGEFQEKAEANRAAGLPDLARWHGNVATRRIDRAEELYALAGRYDADPESYDPALDLA